MKIEDFAEIIVQRLEIIQRLDCEPENRWYAHFQSGEVKDGATLTSVTGNGDTPENALRNYAFHILGQLLVFNAMDPKRRVEFRVPKDLSL